jgi:hypothetical protein
MPDILVETIPFVVGAMLGVLTSGVSRSWPNLVLLGAGSTIIGTLQSALAGELAGNLLSGAMAVILDSAAVATTWVGVYVALRQGRALFRPA